MNSLVQKMLNTTGSDRYKLRFAITGSDRYKLRFAMQSTGMKQTLLLSKRRDEHFSPCQHHLGELHSEKLESTGVLFFKNLSLKEFCFFSYHP